jgi:hypothetical protein
VRRRRQRDDAARRGEIGELSEDARADLRHPRRRRRRVVISFPSYLSKKIFFFILLFRISVKKDLV